MILNDCSNLHFLRIGENLTAANTASKTSCLGWHREGTDECSPSPFTRARHPRQPSAPERYRRSAASNRDMPPRSPRLRRHVLREVPPQFAGRAPHGQLPSSVAANELDGAAWTAARILRRWKIITSDYQRSAPMILHGMWFLGAGASPLPGSRRHSTWSGSSSSSSSSANVEYRPNSSLTWQVRPSARSSRRTSIPWAPCPQLEQRTNTRGYSRRYIPRKQTEERIWKRKSQAPSLPAASIDRSCHY